MTAYLIIDAGGTFLKSALLTSNGDILSGSSFSICSNSEGTSDEILQPLRNTIIKGLKFAHNHKLKLGGIGIAFPGPFNVEKATPLMEHKFQSIYGLDLREYFYTSTSISPNTPVQFIHDANSVLLGELWKGKAKGFKNVSAVTLGTGLGFAISKNGEVLCNEIGGPYLSIFRTPYKDGILEDYTAKRGFLKIYGKLSGRENTEEITVAEISELAVKGEEAALETFKEIGTILGEVLQRILMENKIECLLFSGQISKSFHFMEPAIQESLQGITMLKKISVVEDIDQSALWGTLRNLLLRIGEKSD